MIDMTMGGIGKEFITLGVSLAVVDLLLLFILVYVFPVRTV